MYRPALKSRSDGETPEYRPMDTYDVLGAVRELVNDPPAIESIDWAEVDRYRIEVESWYGRRPAVSDDAQVPVDAYSVDRFPAWIERADR